MDTDGHQNVKILINYLIKEKVKQQLYVDNLQITNKQV